MIAGKGRPKGIGNRMFVSFCSFGSMAIAGDGVPKGNEDQDLFWGIFPGIVGKVTEEPKGVGDESTLAEQPKGNGGGDGLESAQDGAAGDKVTEEPQNIGDAMTPT